MNANLVIARVSLAGAGAMLVINATNGSRSYAHVRGLFRNAGHDQRGPLLRNQYDNLPLSILRGLQPLVTTA